MINAKLQSIIDTKSAIGNAIVNKGGTITGETPFFNYAAQIDGISTGTPQTIFAASDGSKWARTNAVNLVNDAGNTTSDFNWWQPANNGTSDPILNVGTVNGNISGNIRIVQVNQVNIAQYGNIVINDTTGAKYVGYNGYDANTNPTPTGNTTFNRWLLNNSASGTIIFANTTITNGGTYNGPNAIINEADMTRIVNSANYGGSVKALASNNSFIYAAGDTNQRIQKFFESNLVRATGTNVSNNYLGTINQLVINNGFIYAGGEGSERVVKKYHESNLAFVGNTSNNGSIRALTINNSFIYASGAFAETVQKFHESNLAFISNTVSYGDTIWSITINNGFLYVAGSTNIVSKYHESNLAFVENSGNYGSSIYAIKINNGFIYAAGFGGTVHKYYENNLAFVGNTANYGGAIEKIIIDNGFIYAGGRDIFQVKKYNESNLSLVGNTVNFGGTIRSLITNNGFIYAGGANADFSNGNVQKFQKSGITPDTQTFYTATKIKE
jgi:hypothetical protein